MFSVFSRFTGYAVLVCLIAALEVDTAEAVAERLQGALLAAAGAGPATESDFAERAGGLAAALEGSFDVTAVADTLAARLGVEVPTDREQDFRSRVAFSLAAEWVAEYEGLGLDGAGPCSAGPERGGLPTVVGSLSKGAETRLELEFLVGRSAAAQDDGPWLVRGLRVDGIDSFGELGASLAERVPPGDLDALEAELTRRAGQYSATPSEVVEGFQAELLSIMKAAAELGYPGRFERMRLAVGDTHDIAAMTKLSLSRAWPDLSAGDRVKLIERFEALSHAAYAANFDGYGGELFALVEAKPMRRGVLILSTLQKSDGELVQFDYLMHRRDGRWLIVNITVNGVSDLALKRVEFGKLIEKDGVDGLVAELDSQITRYERGSE